jgi:hypothetical protein
MTCEVNGLDQKKARSARNRCRHVAAWTRGIMARNRVIPVKIYSTREKKIVTVTGTQLPYSSVHILQPYVNLKVFNL